MKRKAATPPSEDNSAHLEGVAGALGCVWKGPDLEQEGAQSQGAADTKGGGGCSLYSHPQSQPVLIFFFPRTEITGPGNR